MKKKRDDRQLDLFAWAASRPTAKILDMIPGLAKRLWRERAMQQPHNPDTPVVPLRPTALVDDERRRA